MTQTPRDVRFQAAFGERLGVLLEQYLLITLSELAERLGYANESALRKVRKGLACLSAEKLAALAALPLASQSQRISVDWLLTGHGTPLSSDGLPASADVPQRVAQAPAELQRTIAHFLDVQEANPVTLSASHMPRARGAIGTGRPSRPRRR